MLTTQNLKQMGNHPIVDDLAKLSLNGRTQLEQICKPIWSNGQAMGMVKPSNSI